MRSMVMRTSSSWEPLSASACSRLVCGASRLRAARHWPADGLKFLSRPMRAGCGSSRTPSLRTCRLSFALCGLPRDDPPGLTPAPGLVFSEAEPRYVDLETDFSQGGVECARFDTGEEHRNAEPLMDAVFIRERRHTGEHQMPFLPEPLETCREGEAHLGLRHMIEKVEGRDAVERGTSESS